QIDLSALTPLADDIGKLTDSLDGSLAFNLRVRLSSDVREHVQSLYSLLISVRALVAEQHNRSVKGAPLRVIHLDLQYFDELVAAAGALAVHRTLSQLTRLNSDICGEVADRFFFS